MLDWSRLINYRDQIHKRYPRIWDLKLIKRPSWLMKKHLRPAMRILDAGKVETRKRRDDINCYYGHLPSRWWAILLHRSVMMRSIASIFLEGTDG
jgi:hypothetical protein